MKKTNTGFRGISAHKASGKYEAKVNITHKRKSKSYYIGLYETLPEAVDARIQFINNLI